MPSLTTRPHRHRSYPKDYGRVQFAKDTKVPEGTPSAVFTHLLPADAPCSHQHNMHITRSPSGTISHTRIHPLLATHQQPVVNYDLSLPPSHAIVHVTSRQLAEPATHPPQQMITILCPLLPWPITIGGHSSRIKGPYVSVCDVLDGIYTELRRGVTGEEFSSYLSAPTQMRASDAYRKRYRRIKDDNEYQREKQKGLRRIDFLLEYRRWQGLISTMNGPSVWELKVART